MGPEWVLGLLLIAALWLGIDACRVSKRLHTRLSRVLVDRPRLVEGGLFESAYDDWPTGR